MYSIRRGHQTTKEEKAAQKISVLLSDFTLDLEKIGYSLCPNGHMGSNTLWCKSLSDWTNQYNSWMNTPGENTSEISSIFFDYEIAFGDQKIEDAITDIIFVNTRKNKLKQITNISHLFK